MILYFIYILIFIIVYIREKSKKRIIWDKNKIITPTFNEKRDEINYLFKNISFKLYIRKKDYISSKIRKTHSWHDCDSIFNVWNKYSLWNFNVFLDVGANIGACSLLMLHLHKKVISFEPIKNNLYLFSKSVLYNKHYMDNITLYMIGLGEETRKKAIYINTDNWGGSSLFVKTKHLMSEQINIYKLDDIKLAIKDNIGMMKIDVECSELNMIKGAIEFIKHHFIKIIYFEHNCSCYEYNNNSPDDIYFILQTLGYMIVNELNCTKIESDKKYITRNIIAIKSDSKS